MTADAGGVSTAAVAAGAGAPAAAGLWPAAEFSALFFLQREIARDLLALLLLIDAPDAGEAAAAAAEVAAAHEQLLDVGEAARSDVMRVYRYQRPLGAVVPGMRAAATSAHADVGLLTLSPLSTAAGLVLLRPAGDRWTNVEAEGAPPKGRQRFIAFLGEAGARLLAGRRLGAGVRARAGARVGAPADAAAAPLLRAPVHFVDERGAGGGARFSAPFFLRAPGEALLAPGLTNAAFLCSLAQRPWARLRSDQEPRSFSSDF